MLFLWLSWALADEVNDQLDVAKEALKNEKHEKLSRDLKKLKKKMGQSARIIKPQEVSDIWFLEGLSHIKRKDNDAAIPFFRSALIVYPERTFANPFIDQPEIAELFLSIQSEISYRETSNPNVPRSFGTAKIYIDGKEVDFETQVPEGEHLAQVICPKGDVYTKWTRFSSPYKWAKMCPYKFDMRAPCPEQEADPMFAELDAEIPEHCQEGGAPVTTTEIPSKKSSKGSVNTSLLIGSAVTAVAAGTVYYLAVQERTTFDHLGTGAITSIDELDTLKNAINNKVYLSVGLGGAAVGLCAGAVWLGHF